MQRWLERAREAVWPMWSYEEMIQIKLLFLDYLGKSFEIGQLEESVRLAEHLEAFGGEEQAMLFATGNMVSAPQAALGNAAIHDAPLLFPTVLAAIELQNKGGKELTAALGAGLEAAHRLGDHPQAQLLGALLGVANAFELDEDGWQILLGAVLNNRNFNASSGMARALLAHDLIVAGALARDEWSDMMTERGEVPVEWLQALQLESEESGLNSFLNAIDLNTDEIVATFRARSAGKIPAPHIEYYIDAVMGLEDICCVPLFYRR
ncbi:hypothetical protein CIG75_09065 [Tumebacillus algifaecis]|uniref:Uncharacterized protein n=1 Tax=Tumebacillus algifaecis TaxID=1214604 RepID=A0A223D0H4_9BACL|nr:hypothetical protein [Tumebacillus algifaecis]ASS75112.1 hypothetical protein CIG75_09065 [Tumebacillus algifaecis]